MQAGLCGIFRPDLGAAFGIPPEAVACLTVPPLLVFLSVYSFTDTGTASVFLIPTAFFLDRANCKKLFNRKPSAALRLKSFCR